MALAFGIPAPAFGQASTCPALLGALATLLRELRLTAGILLPWLRRPRATAPYETTFLDLSLDLLDTHGQRAVLIRRQGIRVRRGDGLVVRELVWGEGDQLVRYRSAGAQRLTVRAEGSRRAVLLAPPQRPRPGDRLLIESRRTIRGGFRAAEEYCEVLLERPTGRLALTITFPNGRAPRQAVLVAAPTETLLRRLRVRYRPDGRAVLRCQLHQPATATLYSLRWTW